MSSTTVTPSSSFTQTTLRVSVPVESQAASQFSHSPSDHEKVQTGPSQVRLVRGFESESQFELLTVDPSSSFKHVTLRVSIPSVSQRALQLSQVDVSHVNVQGEPEQVCVEEGLVLRSQFDSSTCVPSSSFLHITCRVSSPIESHIALQPSKSEEFQENTQLSPSHSLSLDGFVSASQYPTGTNTFVISVLHLMVRV